MSDQVETMAYRIENESDKPWHGLGNAIDHDATPKEMLVQAGLDWTVSKRQTYAAKAGLSIQDSPILLPGQFALVRDSDEKVLGPAGKDYLPTQNVRAFEFFKQFTDAGMMRMETAGSLQGGKQVWVLAKLLWSFTLPGGDEVRGYLLLSSPHIWGKSLTIKFVTIRVVCMNTFVVAMKETTFGSSFRMTHSQEFDEAVQDEAAEQLGLAKALFDKFELSATTMAKAKITEAAAVRYVAEIMSPASLVQQLGSDYARLSSTQKASVILDPNSKQIPLTSLSRSAQTVVSTISLQPGSELESSRGTVWGAFNAITRHIDHSAGRSRDNALFSSWFGPKAVIKTKALDLAVKVALAAA